MRDIAAWLVTYLANAAWQVPLVFAVAWLSARLLARVSARLEHRVWVGGLVAAVVLPGCSLPVLRPLSGAAGVSAGKVSAQVSMAAASHGRGAFLLPISVMGALLCMYAGVVVFFTVRLMWGLWKTRRIAAQADSVAVEGEMGAIWHRCTEKFEVKDARMAVSSAVSGPVVVGFGASALLVPRNFLEEATAIDCEAALAHEFAHMKRRDFAKNALYRFMLLPVAWHPVARMLAARIAESREAVCDQMAAAVLEGRREYAHSLLRLAQMLADGPRVEPIHAIGIFDGNTLERRVVMLMTKQVEMKRARRLVSVAACVALTVAACGSALALRLRVDGGAAAAAGTVNPDQAKKDGNVTPVHIVHRVAPVYPPEARKNPVDGVVVLEALISTDGAVEDLRVVKSLRADYDQSALDAVRQWTFTPAMHDGAPTAVETHIQISYSMK